MSARWPVRVVRVSEAVETGKPSRDVLEGIPRNVAPQHCGWCGRRLEQAAAKGRRRRYCGQSCRQRAYERRAAVQRSGLPEDAVVLSDAELTALQDRLFQVRCAAEDVVTAAEDGAANDELRRMAQELAHTARELERLR